MTRERERWDVPPLCTTRSQETNQPKINLWSHFIVHPWAKYTHIHIQISATLFTSFTHCQHIFVDQRVIVRQRNTFSCCFHFQYNCQRDSEERRKECLRSSSGQLKPKAIIQDDYWALVLPYPCSHSLLTTHRTLLLSSDHVGLSIFWMLRSIGCSCPSNLRKEATAKFSFIYTACSQINVKKKKNRQKKLSSAECNTH